MRFKQTDIRKVTEEKEIVVNESIRCNKCGKEKERDFHSEYFEDYEEGIWDTEFQTFSFGFGYGSRYDTEQWSFDLCDDCLTEIVKTFQYVPDGFMLDRSWNIVENDHEHQLIFDDWKETGQWEDLKFKKYDEIIALSGIFNTDYINEIIKKYHPDKPLIDDN